MIAAHCYGEAFSIFLFGGSKPLWVRLREKLLESKTFFYQKLFTTLKLVISVLIWLRGVAVSERVLQVPLGWYIKSLTYTTIRKNSHICQSMVKLRKGVKNIKRARGYRSFPETIGGVKVFSSLGEVKKNF